MTAAFVASPSFGSESLAVPRAQSPRRSSTLGNISNPPPARSLRSAHTIQNLTPERLSLDPSAATIVQPIQPSEKNQHARPILRHAGTVPNLSPEGPRLSTHLPASNNFHGAGVQAATWQGVKEPAAAPQKDSTLDIHHLTEALRAHSPSPSHRPVSPSRKRPEPHPDIDHNDHQLLQHLHNRKLHSEATKHHAAKLPGFSGDRGSLAHSGNTAAGSYIDHPLTDKLGNLELVKDIDKASPSSSALLSGSAKEFLEGSEALAQEVAAKELELRILRNELEEKQQEIIHLEEITHDLDIKLEQAAGLRKNQTTKVEAIHLHQHAVLKASASRLDHQVEALRRRLAKMEWELAEKDEDIVHLRQATSSGAHIVTSREHELSQLYELQARESREVAKLLKDSELLHKHLVTDKLKLKVQVHIEQESHDSALLQERREYQRQIDAFNQEIQTLGKYILQLENKNKIQAEEVSRQEHHLKALSMEERLCVAASQLGHETAFEQKRGQLDEQRQLEAKLRQQLSRKVGLETKAQAYDFHEVDAHQLEAYLAALTACMKEVSKTLHEEHGTSSKEAVDSVIETFKKTCLESGQLPPEIVRTGVNEHKIGYGPSVRLTLSNSGQLYVREYNGFQILLMDFLHKYKILKMSKAGQPPSSISVPTPSTPPATTTLQPVLNKGEVKASVQHSQLKHGHKPIHHEQKPQHLSQSGSRAAHLFPGSIPAHGLTSHQPGYSLGTAGPGGSDVLHV